jgi:site-specific recombinase XerD
MSASLAFVERVDLSGALGQDLLSAIDLAKAEKAPSTRRAYSTDFRLFEEWCATRSSSTLPASPEAVAAYLAHGVSQGAKASTLGRRVAAIRYAHKLANLPTPTDSEGVKATLRGIRRTIGTARIKKAPALADRIKAMVDCCPNRLTGKRDRALLLLGFAGAFRRSELVGLDVEHIEEISEGLRVYIAASKTDQESQGTTIAITRGLEACPVRAVREWLDASCIKHGAIFRPVNKAGQVSAKRLTDRSVANIVKNYAGCAGLDAKLFSGHSLRRGFLTSAAGRGASIFKMMDVSRHKSVDTLREYVRDAEIFKDHAGAGLL